MLDYCVSAGVRSNSCPTKFYVVWSRDFQTFLARFSAYTNLRGEF